MDYEKKYKDAVSAIKFLLYKSERGNFTADKYREELESIIPELKESEDERIRKAIIEIVKKDEERIGTNAHLKKIQWLEKQGEQKPVVPMFRIGDVVENVFTHDQRRVTSIKDDSYITDNVGFIGFHDQDDWVLVEQKPAEWDEEDEKMLNKLLAVVNLYYVYGGNVLDKRSCTSFLKSLKDRVQLQLKQEWSKEDEKMIGNIRSIIEKYAFSQSAVDVNGELCEKEYIEADNWLKSLRPQNGWRPSDEQIMYIGEAIDLAEGGKRFSVAGALKDLRKQLRNLKGE